MITSKGLTSLAPATLNLVIFNHIAVYLHTCYRVNRAVKGQTLQPEEVKMGILRKRVYYIGH